MATPSSFFYTDFVPVNRKKRKPRAPPREPESPFDTLQRLRDQLARDSDWLPQCQQILSESFVGLAAPPEEVICLGLGSPSASPNARVQLAFLLAICEHLNIGPEKVSLYDPVFTADDYALLGTLHMNVLTENKASPLPSPYLHFPPAFAPLLLLGGPTPDAKYALTRPTLCFMPHCDMELYENIIKANWTRQRIPFLMLVANRLMDYIDSNPRHKLESRAPFLLALAPTLECRPFPPSPQWPTAFNNTAVQVFGGGDDLELPDA